MGEWVDGFARKHTPRHQPIVKIKMTTAKYAQKGFIKVGLGPTGVAEGEEACP